MDFEYVTAKVVPGDGPNVDSGGNRFGLVPESVVWYDTPEYGGFCGCGDPTVIDEALVDYLSCLDHDEWKDRPSFQEMIDRCGGERAFYFCAYIADSLGWTDHGGSVLGAWLTDAGKINLAALRWFVSQTEVD